MRIFSHVCGEVEVREDGPGWADFWPTWADGTWEPHTLAWLRRLDLRDRVFVDVGAWIGPVSFWAYALGARVVALEPDEVAFRALWSNIEENAYWGILVGRCAVTPEYGLVSLVTNGEFGNSSSRIGENGVSVPGDTLPSILAYLGISPSEVAGVNVDIEGYEHTLMPVLQPWLDEHGIPFQVEPH